jgi:hypothetical protein
MTGTVLWKCGCHGRQRVQQSKKGRWYIKFIVVGHDFGTRGCMREMRRMLDARISSQALG